MTVSGQNIDSTRCESNTALIGVMIKIFAAFFAVAALWGHAVAQTPPDPLPERTSLDARNVDLLTGEVFIPGVTDVAIGDLAYARTFVDDGWRSSTTGTITASGSTYHVSIGTSADVFTKTGSTYTDDDARGATLVESGSNYIYAAPNGVTFTFGTALFPSGGTSAYAANVVAAISQVANPNGVSTTFHYKEYSGSGGFHNSRLQSITSNLGYQLHFEHSLNGTPTGSTDAAKWRRVTKVTAFNNKVDSCSTSADSCTGFTETWPTVEYTYSDATIQNLLNPLTVKDAEDRTTTYTYDSSTGRITSIKRPSATSADITYTYVSGKVDEVEIFDEIWEYDYADASGERTTTVTDPLSNTSEVVSEIATGLVQSVEDELGREVTYTYDTNDRLKRITQPEGNYVQYAYDSRGNVTSTTSVSKSGSDSFVTSATYPSGCSNQKICNKPETTTDARGEVTDYTYDSTHGGVLTVTAPDPGNGVRPKSTYTYTSIGGVYLLDTVSACATTSSCSGTADQTITDNAYDTSSSSATYRLRTALTVKAGDYPSSSTLASRTAYTYDNFGRLKVVNGPVPGSDDARYFFYDLTGRQVGVIGADPDGGAGSLKHSAVRTTYNDDGQPYLTERGTVTSTSSSPWDSTFATLQKSEVFYDDYARPVKAHLFDGATSTILGLSQISYDELGRVRCTALRMNPSAFSSPGAPCTPTSVGSFGADRITRTYFDAAGQVSKVVNAYGTELAQDSVIYAYTDNGLVESVIDARGNKTGYIYDGFDRREKTCFPSKTVPGTVSSTDCEQIFYDDADGGLVEKIRPRIGHIASSAAHDIEFAYDDLGRITSKVVPSAIDGDVNYIYEYDNFGRKLTGGVQNFRQYYEYDALGRLTSHTYAHTARSAGDWAVFDYNYDNAGRMTGQTHPDGYQIDYTYDVLGRPETVSHDSNRLAKITYDDHGRRASIGYGEDVNGDPVSSQTYDFDGLSRLTELTNDLNGTSDDQTYEFDYNPASQIIERTRTNATFDFALGTDYDDSYAANGLNQYDVVAAVSVTHDGNGNITTDHRGHTYEYMADNFLRRVKDGSTTLRTYLPWADGTIRYHSHSPARFYYDPFSGEEVIETDNTAGVTFASNNIERRYIRIPGSVDQPFLMIDYVSSGCSSGCEVYTHTDARGSVVATSDDSGDVIDIYTYSEFGESGAEGDSGFPFRFTGQKLDAVTGLYHYKARWYDPETGRFLQTDPIGYGDGMNMYAYVGNDPVNGTDPTGMYGNTCATCHYIDGTTGGYRQMHGILGYGSSGGSGVAGNVAAHESAHTAGAGSGYSSKTANTPPPPGGKTAGGGARRNSWPTQFRDGGKVNNNLGWEVTTPYGKLEPANALAMRWAFVRLGTRAAAYAIRKNTNYKIIYRVWDGVKAQEFGGSWTTDDPRKMQDWRDELAVLPKWNQGTYLSIGAIHKNDFYIGAVGPQRDLMTGKLYRGGATEIFPTRDGAEILLLESGIPFDG